MVRPSYSGTKISGNVSDRIVPRYLKPNRMTIRTPPPQATTKNKGTGAKNGKQRQANAVTVNDPAGPPTVRTSSGSRPITDQEASHMIGEMADLPQSSQINVAPNGFDVNTDRNSSVHSGSDNDDDRREQARKTQKARRRFLETCESLCNDAENFYQYLKNTLKNNTKPSADDINDEFDEVGLYKTLLWDAYHGYRPFLNNHPDEATNAENMFATLSASIKTLEHLSDRASKASRTSRNGRDFNRKLRELLDGLDHRPRSFQTPIPTFRLDTESNSASEPEQKRFSFKRKSGCARKTSKTSKPQREESHPRGFQNVREARYVCSNATRKTKKSTHVPSEEESDSGSDSSTLSRYSDRVRYGRANNGKKTETKSKNRHESDRRRYRTPSPDNSDDITSQSESDNEEAVDFLPDSWYRNRFPSPWNKPPRPAADARDRHSAPSTRHLRKFAGDPDTYIGWRQRVIHSIHRHPCNWQDKLAALEHLIDTTQCPTLKSVMPTTEWSPKAYEQLVKSLESMYGGEQRTLHYYLKEIRNVRRVHEQDFDSFSALLTNARAYYDVLRSHGRDHEIRSGNTFRDVFSRLGTFWQQKFISQRKQPMRGAAPSDMTLKQLLKWMVREQQDRLDLQLYNFSKPIRNESGSFTHDRRKPKSHYRAYVTRDTTSSDSDSSEPRVSFTRDTKQRVDTTNTKPKGRHETKTPKYVLDELTVKGLPTRPKPTNRAPNKPNEWSCPTCQGGTHEVRDCEGFKNLSLAAKADIVRSFKICYNCLSSMHFVSKCQSKKRCDHCNRGHHTLLHDPRRTHGQPGTLRTLLTRDKSDDEAESEPGWSDQASLHGSD